jgi:hypothetical protein
MRGIPEATPVMLTEVERTELEALARSTKTEYRLRHHAAIAEDPELTKVARGRHEEEQSKIIQKLEQMVADNFKDASELLEFAIERLLIFGAEAKDASGIRMLRNVKEAPTGDKLGNVIRAEISATAVFYWPAGLSDAVPVLVHFFRGAVGRRFACLWFGCHLFLLCRRCLRREN